MFRKENDGQMRFADQFFGSSDPVSDDHVYLSVDLALQKALNITFLEAQVKVHYIEKRGKRIRKVIEL